MPSLYEGFSLPAIEAMSCGVPLVATSGGALPEVVGADNDTALVRAARRQRRRWPPRSPWPSTTPRCATASAPPAASGSSTAGPGATPPTAPSSTTGPCWPRPPPSRPAAPAAPSRPPLPPRPGRPHRLHPRRPARHSRSGSELTDAHRRLRHASACAPATCCSTSAAASAAMPSRASAAAPGSIACDMALDELRRGRRACSTPWSRPARPRRRPGRLRQRRRHLPAVPRRHVRPHHRQRGHGAHPRRPRRARRAAPGAQARRHAGRHHPGLAPREDLLGPQRRVPRPVRRVAATSASTPRTSCATRCAAPASTTAQPTTPTPCTPPYWWLKCAVGPTNDDFPLVKPTTSSWCGTS